MFQTENFYMKKIYYGDYVKNVFLPMEVINNNIANKDGVKNTGKNNSKLRTNNVRTKAN